LESRLAEMCFFFGLVFTKCVCVYRLYM